VKPEKRKLLGYGIFTGELWGKEMKNWKFEEVVGIQPSKAEAEALDRRIHHCLSRETRRIYTTTPLNVGSRNSPRFIKASVYIKRRPQ
jgi:hypothetical protein